MCYRSGAVKHWQESGLYQFRLSAKPSFCGGEILSDRSPSGYSPILQTVDTLAKRRPKGLGECFEEGWSYIFPDLLPTSHVCLAVDQRGCVAAHDCPDAGTLIDTDRSQVCAGSRPKSARCDEEIGRAEEVDNWQSRGC